MEQKNISSNLNKKIVIKKLKNIFSNRGISNIKTDRYKLQKISLFSMISNHIVKTNIIKLINKLEINKNIEVLIKKRKIEFNENVFIGPLVKNFSKREKSQKLFIYNYVPEKPLSKVQAPLVIFSHGGTIRNNTSLKSPFLSIIKQYGEKLGNYLMLVTLDHRGSGSHKEKQKYSLEDRIADFEITLYVALTTLLDEYQENGVEWNGNIIFMGNSMGGHVATIAASELHPNALMLSQPAAYAEQAQKLPFGYKFTKAIRIKNSWKTSPAFDALEEYLESGGNAIIIEANKDKKIPPEIIKRYAKELTYNFAKNISRKRFKNNFIHVPGSHEALDLKEVEILNKSLLD